MCVFYYVGDVDAVIRESGLIVFEIILFLSCFRVVGRLLDGGREVSFGCVGREVSGIFSLLF